MRTSHLCWYSVDTLGQWKSCCSQDWEGHLVHGSWCWSQSPKQQVHCQNLGQTGRREPWLWKKPAREPTSVLCPCPHWTVGHHSPLIWTRGWQPTTLRSNHAEAVAFLVWGHDVEHLLSGGQGWPKTSLATRQEIYCSAGLDFMSRWDSAGFRNPSSANQTRQFF